MTWKIEAVLKDKKASEWVLARTGKIYPIKVIYECARIKILTFKDEVPEDPAVTENILVTVKGKNPKWKLTVELLNVRDASSVSAVPVGTVWISSALCCDQTAEGLPSLLPQRNKRGGGGRPVLRRLSANPRKEAVESQRRRVDTCQQLPNKHPVPHKRLCFIYKYMMEKVGQHPSTPLMHTSNIRPRRLISLGQQRNLHNWLHLRPAGAVRKILAAREGIMICKFQAEYLCFDETLVELYFPSVGIKHVISLSHQAKFGLQSVYERLHFWGLYFLGWDFHPFWPPYSRPPRPYFCDVRVDDYVYTRVWARA